MYHISLFIKPYKHVRNLEYYKARMFPVVCSMKYMYSDVLPNKPRQDAGPCLQIPLITAITATYLINLTTTAE